MAYQEQVSDINRQLVDLERRKNAAENLGFTENSEVLQREIDNLNARKNQIQNELSTQLAASGQTATAPFNGNFAPNKPGTGPVDTTQNLNQPVTADQKARLDQSKTGELAGKVQQSQDPVAANKQNTQAGTAQPKSEENFSGDKIPNSADSITGSSNKVSSKNSDYVRFIGSGLPKNKLHDYTSYTYRITLFLLTKKDFNDLATSPTTFEPRYALISSGGSYAQKTSQTVEVTVGGTTAKVIETTRHPDFQTDFFIDNLSMTTVVGLNAKSKASNAVEISFNITEPYGLSLLDRLLSVCETSGDKNPNYMEQPYLLQIDILASPTDEQMIRSKKTNNIIDSKKIAIKLLEMKIKPSGSGTQYAVRAMPYNHTAFSLTVAAMPVSMSVEASTVGEFFSSTDDLVKLFAGEVASQQERLESNLKTWLDEFSNKTGTSPTPEQIENQRQALKNAIVYNSRSLTASYNVYTEKIAKQQNLSKLPPVKIAFNIPDQTIANSPIVDSSAQASDTQMYNQSSSYGLPNSQYKKTQNFSINHGTSVLDIIDMVMGKSDYIKNQIVTRKKEVDAEQAQNDYTNNSSRANDKKTPPLMNWYKVIPSVALNDFDSSRNAYSKTILYSILPYKTANAYHPNFPKSNTETLENSIVREYNYLYTGKNQDIIKLDIDFDSTFYTQLTTYRNQLARLGNDRGSDPNDVPDNQFSFGANVQQTNPPVTIHYAGSNSDSNSMNTAANPTEKVVADLKKSLYTSQRGDALNIKLQIIGDPDFIKQDDIFFNPGSPAEYNRLLQDRLSNITAPINSSGQILFDAEQIYVRLLFKNAVDIDDSIGIVNKQEKLTNGRMTDGTFSGIYKVLQVVSTFSRGEFTQTLELIRMPEAISEISIQPPKTTDSGSVPATRSAKQNESSDQSKKSVISANPAGVAPRVSPELIAAANQNPVAAPVVNSGTGSPAAVSSAYQSAPQNANNAQNISPQNTAGWSFQDAFSQARKDFGNKPGGVFEWRGKLYQTNYQNEPFVANPVPVYPGANQ